MPAADDDVATTDLNQGSTTAQPAQEAPAPAAGAAPRAKRPSGAQRRKEAAAKAAAADTPPMSAAAAAPKVPGRRKSADVIAIERSIKELINFGSVALTLNGMGADAEVLTTVGPDWVDALGDVIEKRPELKRLLGGGARMTPEVKLLFLTAKLAWLLKQNHQGPPKVAGPVSSPPARGAGAGPAAPRPPADAGAGAGPSPDRFAGIDPTIAGTGGGFAGVSDVEGLDADVMAMLAGGFRVEDPAA